MSDTPRGVVLGGVKDRHVLEAEVEAYLSLRVKAVGGLTRKVAWVGNRNAPDRLVALPYTRNGDPGSQVIFVEVKRPGLLRTFPNNAHERAQAREHKRMRSYGMIVVVVDSTKGVDELLAVEVRHAER